MTYNKDIKKIKNALLVVVFLVVSHVSVFSQIEAQITQYMFHQAAYNPAAIAENRMINITGQHRIQWMGIPGAPQTTFFSANMPFKLGKSTHGVGIVFLRDQAGAFLNQSANVQYAYKKRMGDGVLSAGAGVGFISIGFIAEMLKNDIESEYHGKDKIDNKVPTTDEYGMGLDVNLGLFYSAPKYYLGVSYAHVNNPSFQLGDKTTFHTRGIAYFTGGYDVGFDESKFLVRSSSLVKTDFTTFQVDLSSRLEYDKRFWGGLSYRFQESVAVFGGVNLFSGMMVGYSYDIPTMKLFSLKNGSHELFISYSFAFDTSKNKNKYKSIRIL